MASSQVEVGSSYPFGCVLTSHNGRRDSCSSTTTHAKNMTRDHHPNSINVPMISPDSAAPNNKSTHKKPSWVSRVAKNNHQGSLSFFTTRKVENFHGDDKDDSSSSSSSSLLTTVVLDHVEVIEEEFPSSRSTSSFSSPRREVSLSPPHSDDSSDQRISSNLGASSLVQIWEKRLNQSNSNATSKSNTPRTSPDRDHCSRVVSEEGEYSCDEQQPFTDWESDQSKAPPNSSDAAAAAAEREWGRVADLIKRLTVTKQIQSDNENNNDHEFLTTASTYTYNPSTPKQVEHRSSSFGRVKSFPRIRGRQAFNDLIMQFACDRRGELHKLAERGAVSKFTQRGRIQSLLRLRLLQRGVAAFDPPNYNYQKSEGNYNKQEGSAIMQLKKRFNTGDVQRTSSLTVGSNPRSLDRVIISNTTTRLDNFPPASNQLSKDTTVINCEKHTQNSVPPQTSTTDNKEVNYTSSNITLQAQNDEPKQTAGASLPMANSNANDDTSETRDRQYDTVETCYYEIVEELEASDRNCDEARPNYDWISNISRPRSYWEKLRQEWYSEMLGFGSQNDERRKLLERRTVSSVLSSDFPERMDKLMKSHRGIETQYLTSNQYDEEGREQLMAFFQDRLRVRGSIPEEDGRDSREEEEEAGRRNAEEEKEEENGMISGGLDHDHSGYQSSSPANTPSSSTWSNRDNDGVDDSDRVAASESSLLPSQSQSFYQDTPQYSSPSTNHHSIEMDFIYDMRGQMEQLFREMSELRKSISSCMNMQMQMQMQQSKNQEVVHAVKVKEKKFHKKTTKKGHCCICYEKKANAVLYRCGHMCACLKCAKELQWNSGKCPICEAPIIDVVQVQN